VKYLEQLVEKSHYIPAIRAISYITPLATSTDHLINNATYVVLVDVVLVPVVTVDVVLVCVVFVTVVLFAVVMISFGLSISHVVIMIKNEVLFVTLIQYSNSVLQCNHMNPALKYSICIVPK
jgi:hypothetical protein